MEFSPDHIVYYQKAFVSLNATIVFTWGIILFLVLFSWSVTRRLTRSTDFDFRQNLLEILVDGLLNQIRETTRQDPERFLPLLGTLFIFILVSKICTQGVSLRVLVYKRCRSPFPNSYVAICTIRDWLVSLIVKMSCITNSLFS